MNKFLPICLFALTTIVHAQSTAKLGLFERDVYVIEPNIDMALALTSEQQEKIESALMALKDSPDLKALKDEARTDEAAKETYQQALDAAQKEYLAKAVATLDAKQLELIESASAFAKQIHAEHQTEISTIIKGLKEGTTKWSDRLALLHKYGQERIGELLTPEQIAAIRANSPESDPAPSGQ